MLRCAALCYVVLLSIDCNLLKCATFYLQAVGQTVVSKHFLSSLNNPLFSVHVGLPYHDLPTVSGDKEHWSFQIQEHIDFCSAGYRRPRAHTAGTDSGVSADGSTATSTGSPWSVFRPWASSSRPVLGGSEYDSQSTGVRSTFSFPFPFFGGAASSADEVTADEGPIPPPVRFGYASRRVSGLLFASSWVSHYCVLSKGVLSFFERRVLSKEQGRRSAVGAARNSTSVNMKSEDESDYGYEGELKKGDFSLKGYKITCPDHVEIGELEIYLSKGTSWIHLQVPHEQFKSPTRTLC